MFLLVKMPLVFTSGSFRTLSESPTFLRSTRKSGEHWQQTGTPQTMTKRKISGGASHSQCPSCRELWVQGTHQIIGASNAQESTCACNVSEVVRFRVWKWLMTMIDESEC